MSWTRRCTRLPCSSLADLASFSFVGTVRIGLCPSLAMTHVNATTLQTECENGLFLVIVRFPAIQTGLKLGLRTHGANSAGRPLWRKNRTQLHFLQTARSASLHQTEPPQYPSPPVYLPVVDRLNKTHAPMLSNRMTDADR